MAGATLGMGVVFQTVTAKKRQEDLEAEFAKAIEEAETLATQQNGEAFANWMKNQELQEIADDIVFLESQQSEANRNYWIIKEQAAEQWAAVADWIALKDQTLDVATGLETQYNSLKHLLTAQEKLAFEAQLEALHNSFATYNSQSVLDASGLLAGGFSATVANAIAREKARQEAHSHHGGGFSEASDKSTTVIPYAPGQKHLEIKPGGMIITEDGGMNTLEEIASYKAKGYTTHLLNEYDVAWQPNYGSSSYLPELDLKAIYNIFESTKETAIALNNGVSDAANELFKKVMGPITVAYNHQDNLTKDGQATKTTYENGKHVITINPHAEPATSKFKYNFTHELGHVFFNQVNGVNTSSNEGYLTYQLKNKNISLNPNNASDYGMPHDVSGNDVFLQSLEEGNLVENFADLFSYWVHQGFDDTLNGQKTDNFIESLVVGGMAYQALIQDSLELDSIVNGESGLTLSQNETHITAGLDLVAYIASHMSLHPQVTNSLAVYQAALVNAYGITITEEGTPPALDYTALYNYHQGADALAVLFDETLFEQGITLNRYNLFQQVMGQINIVRTSERPENSGTAFGFNSIRTFYDIFTNGRQSSMSPLNVTHELLHSFYNFSGMGDDSKTPLSSLAMIADQAMQTVDATLLPNEALGIVIRDDYRYYRNGTSPTFRQNFVTDSNNDAYTEETMTDAIMYEAWGLYGLAGNSFSETIQVELAKGIRNAILYNLPPEEQVALLSREGYLPVDYWTVVAGYGIKPPPNVRTYPERADNNLVSGLTVKNDQEYVVFTREESGENIFVSFYNNGRIVWVVDSFDWSSSQISLDSLPTNRGDFDSTFNPNASLNDTPWWISLLQGG